MAKATGDTGLWLPSEFLADKQIGSNADLETAFGFPSEFPYEFGVSSPATGSTETESSDEEEDFFAGLTRRLSQSTLHETRKQLSTTGARNKAEEAAYYSTTKTRDLAGSPQSTLSGIGSWSGRSTVSGDGSPNGHSRVPSPFADPWEVIYAAAGQVARLKMNGQVSHLDFHNKHLVPPGANIFSNQGLNQLQQQVKQKQQCASASVWGRQAKPNWLAQQQQLQAQNRGREVGYETGKCNRPLSLPQSAFPPLQLQHQHQHQRVHYGGSGFRVAGPAGSSVKRGCGGTGVFLPRHYDTPSDSRKKAGCAPVLLPAKAVHAVSMNSNIEDLNATTQPRFSNAFAADYEGLVARRNALLMQQRLSVLREEAANCEIRLPQEWTY